ncbi:hypothetical protein CDV50_02065 [Haematobacter massiliensis]|uniref:Uncharacterized protein n=1 Tax=Haematobacter massiliensis TaxID=195105 RepID=A0A086YBA3_9RHOB|nr:hypothetical protein [Haematobacter massiliensis]KFI31553.1 hypothetical protein CN97_10035 [Haematobacter massiliensis]OWJ73663.1 hypothetical protein CDV50_02065 [Haematobacter massiliensis]OWJ81874.1 hypothetical protein CDV51_18780 [Haematobacter massiliensis]QBJ23425.1 hypothetical protein HmaOT1_03595 [Haematobacter massiliensis]
MSLKDFEPGIARNEYILARVFMRPERLRIQKLVPPSRETSSIRVLMRMTLRGSIVSPSKRRSWEECEAYRAFSRNYFGATHDGIAEE